MSYGNNVGALPFSRHIFKYNRLIKFNSMHNEIVDNIMDIFDNTIVAGGYIVSLLKKTNYNNDIDIFSSNNDALNHFIELSKSDNVYINHIKYNKVSICAFLNKTKNIDFMYTFNINPIHVILYTFDITPCMSYYDGENIHTNDDVLNNIMYINDKYVPSRVLKYINRGFKLSKIPMEYDSKDILLDAALESKQKEIKSINIYREFDKLYTDHSEENILYKYISTFIHFAYKNDIHKILMLFEIRLKYVMYTKHNVLIPMIIDFTNKSRKNILMIDLVYLVINGYAYISICVDRLSKYIKRNEILKYLSEILHCKTIKDHILENIKLFIRHKILVPDYPIDDVDIRTAFENNI